MARTTRKAPAAKATAASDSHSDVDTLTSSAVADPHSTAFAERQKAPNLYDNPTLATPGVLELDEEEISDGPQALLDPDVPEINLDPSVDNRDQVQPMLDTLYEDATEGAGALATATAAINAHESDAVDVEALTEEAAAKREEAREATAKQRDESRSATTADTTKK